MPARPPLRPRLLRPWSAHIAPTQLRAGGRRPYSSSDNQQSSDGTAEAVAATEQTKERRNSDDATSGRSEDAEFDPAIGRNHASITTNESAIRKDISEEDQDRSSTLPKIKRVTSIRNAREVRPASENQNSSISLHKEGSSLRWRTTRSPLADSPSRPKSFGQPPTRRQPLILTVSSAATVQSTLKTQEKSANSRVTPPTGTVNATGAVQDRIRELLLPELQALKELRETIEKRNRWEGKGRAANTAADGSTLEIEQGLAKIDAVLKNRWGIKLSEIAHDGTASQKGGGDYVDELGEVPSLMEELFPEQSVKAESKAREEQQELPRLRLPLKESISGDAAYDVQSRLRQRKFTKQENLPEVLLLRSASQSLTEADFRCLLPKGKHIREWSNAANDLIKVIPARDPVSLEHHGAYFILFSNSASALAYAQRAKQVHRLCKMHTPNSLISPLPPPPGALTGGEDIHALTKTFTLATPSQRFDLRVLPKPYSARVSQLLRNGGELPLVATEGSKVLLKMSGHSDLSRSKIMRIIGDDGRDRGQPWDLVSGPTAVMNLRELVIAISVERKPSANAHDGAHTGPSTEDGIKGDAHSGAEKDIWEKAQMRWLVSFNDGTDAKRFAAAWNGKTIFSGTYDGPEENEVPTVVRAEYLW